MCYLILVVAFFLLILLFSTFLSPLPINDSGLTRYRTVPWATLSLIILNTVIFVLWIAPDLYVQSGEEMTVEPDYTRYMEKVTIYGYSETALRDGTGVAAFAAFSSMFMHAHFWHLFGNMVYLWTFGRRVEDACGSWRFLGFYLLVGMLADVGSVLFNPAMDWRPSVGASGAIAGVMGAYLLLFPTAKVNCLWGLGKPDPSADRRRPIAVEKRSKDLALDGDPAGVGAAHLFCDLQCDPLAGNHPERRGTQRRQLSGASLRYPGRSDHLLFCAQRSADALYPRAGVVGQPHCLPRSLNPLPTCGEGT